MCAEPAILKLPASCLQCQDDALANCRLNDPGCQICATSDQCYKCKAADYAPGKSGKVSLLVKE